MRTMSRPMALGPVGALRAWQARVARDPASRSLFDTLHAAACREANGDEAARDGLQTAAESWYRDAAETLIEAAKAVKAAG
jgi:hypothetical protein